jgi:pimeloyl-ACP methyl ester carboxylesterase
MTLTGTTRQELIKANGTELYCEVRGSGPSVLFISGASGDAGHFSAVANTLADEFTTITYDRRGNSRSPKPAGWTTTTMGERADERRGIVGALGAAPAAVFGTSGGGIVAIDLLVRHPKVVRGAIIHEPAIISVLPYKDEVMKQLKGALDEAFTKGGPRRAMETFLRLNMSDAVFDACDAALRERMLDNAETFFGLELAAFVAYDPDGAALARSRVPLRVLHGDASPAYLVDTTKWLAEKTNVPTAILPGNHVPYLQRPAETAELLRPIFRELI